MALQAHEGPRGVEEHATLLQVPFLEPGIVIERALMAY